jgi:hypothetical protein
MKDQNYIYLFPTTLEQRIPKLAHRNFCWSSRFLLDTGQRIVRLGSFSKSLHSHQTPLDSITQPK